MADSERSGAVLLLDTCGDKGSVALIRPDGTVAEVFLEERAASSTLLRAVRGLLRHVGLSPGELEGVGVVAGPGSFTGVRVGLAVAKGLCEATSIPLAAVSRLRVLAEVAGLQGGLAVLRAGRHQVYLREQRASSATTEQLVDLAALAAMARGGEVVYAEAELEAQLSLLANTRRVELSAISARRAVLECLREGGTPLEAADANYVRDEQKIYRQKADGSTGPRELTVMRAGAGDLADLFTFNAAEHEVPHWPEDAWTRLVEGTEGTQTRVLMLLRDAEGQLRGWVAGNRVGDAAELEFLVVGSVLRRQGAARRLLRAWMAYVTEQGAAEALLEVRAGNVAALALYRAENFVEQGRRPGYYREPHEDAVLMQRRLNVHHAANDVQKEAKAL